jgi:hypothetical protein
MNYRKICAIIATIFMITMIGVVSEYISGTVAHADATQQIVAQQADGRYTLLSHDVVAYGSLDDGTIDVLHDDKLNTTIYVHYWTSGGGSVLDGSAVVIPDNQLKTPEQPVYYIQTNIPNVNASATKIIHVK